MRNLRMAAAWGSVLLAASLVAGVWATGIHEQPKAGVSVLPSAAAAAPASEAQGLPRDLPLKRDVPGEAGGPPWTAMLALLVIAAGAALFVLRRRGPAALLQALPGARGGTAIERVASQALTQQASVHAVRWQGEEFLLGCTATQVTVLARKPAEGKDA